MSEPTTSPTTPCPQGCIADHLGVGFWFTHLLLPFLLLVGLTLLLQKQEWDFRLVDPFYDAQNHEWWGARLWWANQLLHTSGRNLILALGLGSLGLLILSFWRLALRPWRARLLFAVLAIGLTTGLTAIGKQTTNKDCPWSLTRYGGDQPYHHLWEKKAPGLPRGKCFPGGHSSGAFSLLFLYFILRRNHPRPGIAALTGALLLGSLYGYGQWIRGAHFPSHDLWSAAIAWFVSLSIYLLFYRARES